MTIDDPQPGARVRLLRTVLDVKAGTPGEVYQRIGPRKGQDGPSDLFTVRTPKGIVVVRRDEIELDH